MNKLYKILILLVTLSLFLSVSVIAAPKFLPNDKPVKNVAIKDIPYDDAGGLVITWTPLPKEKRILEYRIFRGVTPDSLFRVGRIPVNPKTGVAADTMKYTNQGYTFFIDATSPAKLKKEPGQKKGTKAADILFRKYPRDIKVYGPMLENYRILSVIPANEYLYSSKMKEVTRIDTLEDGTVDTTSTTYAGLKLRQFKYILTKLKPGKTYYYAVQAVNKFRDRSPLSEIVSASPVDNPPEKLKEFYAVAYTDTEKMHFEWSLPFFKSDQKQYNIYLFDANGEKHKIFSRETAYPYTSQPNAIVTYEEIKDKFEAFNSANLEWYNFNIGLQDRQDQETIALDKAIEAEITTSEILPEPPNYFTVTDNPDDKGDKNLVYFGKPYVTIPKINYNDDFTELQVNYDINDNQLFKVKHAIFEVDGVTEKEYVLDRKLEFDVDPQNLPTSITTRFECYDHGVKLPDDYSVTHRFAYDEETQVVEIEPVEESKYSVQVFRMNKTGGGPEANVWRYPKELTYVERSYVDKIGYEESVFRGISDFSIKENMLYTSTYYLVGTWEEQRPYYTTALYLSQLEKNQKEIKEEIENLKVEKSKLKTEEEKEAVQAQIDQLSNRLEDIPPFAKKANAKKSNHARMKLLQKTHNDQVRSFRYFLRKTDGRGHFVDTKIFTNADGEEYIKPIPNWFKNNETITLIAMLIFGVLVFFMIRAARKGKNLYIRPIAGIQEIDNAIGRATEMGRPILFVPGTSGISDVATLAGLAILGKVAKKAAEFDTKILVPVRNYIVLPIAQEIVKEAHYEAGRPDTYDKNSVFFITTAQFAFVSGVNGVMIREQTATNFYMGMFYAESLLMTETGNMTGAIQIAGTDAITQLPFFITTCDYTLIGEELYAASAYLSKQPMILGTLKAQDYMKFLIVISVVVGTILSTLNLTFFMKWFPAK